VSEGRKGKRRGYQIRKCNRTIRSQKTVTESATGDALTGKGNSQGPTERRMMKNRRGGLIKDQVESPRGRSAGPAEFDSQDKKNAYRKNPGLEGQSVYSERNVSENGKKKDPEEKALKGEGRGKIRLRAGGNNHCFLPMERGQRA